MWSHYYDLAQRPPLSSKTHKIKMPCGQRLYITVTYIDDTPLEVFLNIESPDDGVFNILNILKDDINSMELDVLGKISYCHKAVVEALGRVISNWLREGGSPEKIGKTLTNIRCGVSLPGQDYVSCADAVGKLLYNGWWRNDD